MSYPDSKPFSDNAAKAYERSRSRVGGRLVLDRRIRLQPCVRNSKDVDHSISTAFQTDQKGKKNSEDELGAGYGASLVVNQGRMDRSYRGKVSKPFGNEKRAPFPLVGNDELRVNLPSAMSKRVILFAFSSVRKSFVASFDRVAQEPTVPLGAAPSLGVIVLLPSNVRTFNSAPDTIRVMPSAARQVEMSQSPYRAFRIISSGY
jgi:hypothetical protein